MSAQSVLFIGGNGIISASSARLALARGLVDAYRADGFPMTIIRPSHTYDATLIPFDGGWTVLDRLRRGAPIVVHGDGTSLWALTHARDLAPALVGLFGNPHAIGQAVHITSDKVLTWNGIAASLAAALGVEPRIVHVASDTIAREIPAFGPGLVGDKAHSLLFDNSRIRSLVPGWVATTPFAAGAREIVDWHLADPARQRGDADLDAAFDRLVERHG
jgi:nucleoside-diphosphate-sugar epimerase